jgi:hypothetical protein
MTGELCPSIQRMEPDEGNMLRFRNVAFPSYLKFRAMNKIQKTCDSQCRISNYKRMSTDAGNRLETEVVNMNCETGQGF